MHSRCQRRPADLPAHGRKVELILRARQFRCRALYCPAKIFAERFSTECDPAACAPHLPSARIDPAPWSGTRRAPSTSACHTASITGQQGYLSAQHSEYSGGREK
uniref:transposase family protein n=1 Tax=Pontibaca methylaminivorans TaxID=515897 RepID=UPI00389ACA87